MKTTDLVTLTLALLLTAAGFASIYYDAYHGVSHYRGERTIALPAHR